MAAAEDPQINDVFCIMVLETVKHVTEIYTPLKAGYTDYNIDIFSINIILRTVFWCSKSYSVLTLTCQMNCPLSLIVATQTVKANYTVQYVSEDDKNSMLHCNIFCHPCNNVKQIRNLRWGRTSPNDLNKKL